MGLLQGLNRMNIICSLRASQIPSKMSQNVQCSSFFSCILSLLLLFIFIYRYYIYIFWLQTWNNKVKILCDTTQFHFFPKATIVINSACFLLIIYIHCFTLTKINSYGFVVEIVSFLACFEFFYVTIYCQRITQAFKTPLLVTVSTVYFLHEEDRH